VDRDHPGGDGLMLDLGAAEAVVLVVLVLLLAAFVVGVFVVTTVSVLRAPNLTGGVKTLWILGCLMAPVLAPTFWFLYGLPAAQGRSTPADG